MNDILPPISSMNFNPFRSTTPSSTASPAHPQGSRDAVANQNSTLSTSSNSTANIDDSWHTNAPLSPSTAGGVASAHISAPMAWFSSWTATTTTAVSSSHVTSSSADAHRTSTSQSTTAVSKATHETTIQTASLAPPSKHDLPRSPSSFNMLRGWTRMNRTTLHTYLLP